MPKFIIQYYFDGSGSCEVEANSTEEAEEKFSNGEFTNDQDSSTNYNIDHIYNKNNVCPGCDRPKNFVAGKTLHCGNKNCDNFKSLK